MAKYSYEFKKQLVLEYLNNHGGYTFLSQKHGLPDPSQLKKWVAAYKTFGDDGLKRSRSQKQYSFEKKISVVECYITSEFSYQEVALQFGINNPSMVTRWVLEYKAAGPDALRPHRKGRRRTLRKSPAGKAKDLLQQTKIDTSVEHVKELEDENLRLRIENAFLKELRRLRLEDEAKMKALQKSLAVSEDNSN